MSSYVLSKKPLIKRTLIASVLVLASIIIANYTIELDEASRSDSPSEIFRVVSFYVGSFALFVTVISGLSLLILRILVAVGFWTK